VNDSPALLPRMRRTLNRAERRIDDIGVIEHRIRRDG